MTINKEREICLEIAKQRGDYKVFTFTYSNNQYEKECNDGSFGDLFEPDIVTGYTCEMWNLKKDRIILTASADTPFAAKREAMARWAGMILGEAVSHNISSSTFDDTYVLSFGQAAATGLPIAGDLPPTINGDDRKDWLQKKHLSQTEAAKLCSVSSRTFRRWVAGNPKMPKGMWELLRMKAHKL